MAEKTFKHPRWVYARVTHQLSPPVSVLDYLEQITERHICAFFEVVEPVLFLGFFFLPPLIIHCKHFVGGVVTSGVSLQVVCPCHCKFRRLIIFHFVCWVPTMSVMGCIRNLFHYILRFPEVILPEKLASSPSFCEVK